MMLNMTCSSTHSELFDTQTPDVYSILQSQEIITPKPAWGKLFSTTIYLPSIDLVESEFSLGRAIECDVVLTSSNFSPNCLKTISKTHFKILWELGQTFILDLSKNGTFVNKTLIGSGQKVVLQNNDEIAIGTLGQRVYVYKKIENDIDPFLPPNLESKYEILRQLGFGACGEVRLAIEKTTLKEYAIKKIVKPKVNGGKFNTPVRIQNEIEILQSLSHPCIISTKEIAESDEAVFIVLEYMDGGELSDYISSDVPLSEDKVKLLFYQIVLGIRYLHLRDVSHRDLKPGNILLKSKQNDKIVKICDFGLSKILDSNTFMTTLCGTPCFIAPEIITVNVKAYTQQIDVWSLGVILYFMLSNELPFSTKSDSQIELFKLITSGKYSMASNCWENVSANAKDLIRKMLVVNPEERITIHEIMNHPWISEDFAMQEKAKQLLSKDSDDSYSPKCKRAKF